MPMRREIVVSSIGRALLVVLFGAGVALVGCDRDAAAPTQTTASARPAAEDVSLGDDEYVSMGIPSYDREWTGTDMSAAAPKRQELEASDAGKLPRYQSPRSGRMFARLVAQSNLKFFQARSLPLESRLPQALEYGESSSVILKTYLAAFLAGKVSGDDLIELLGGQLRLCE